MLDPFKLYAMRGTEEWPPAIQAYVKSLTVWESHCLEPFVAFLQDLVDGNNVVGEAILEGGIKDYLLHLYVSNFFDPLVKEDSGDFHRTSTLYAACNSLLFILSHTQNGLRSIRGHLFHILWSNHPALPFTPLTNNRLDQRPGIWSSMSKDHVLWRIRSIIEMVDDWHRPYEQELLMDIAVDVLEFSGSEDMGPEIYNRALRALHHFLTAGNNFSQKTILRYMVLGNTEYLFKIIPRMIARISQLVTMNTSGWDTFFLPWPQFVPVNESFFASNAILQIIDSFIGAAQNHQSFLAVLLEANLLGLLRPFLQQELQGIWSMTYHDGDNLLRYDASDFELLATLRKHGLRTLFPSISDNPHIDLRRNILGRAVNILLRRESDIDEIVIMQNEEREINQ
ncbi:hypothetical protein BDZ94DRAFT_1250259 [Collybia nuda]|uniref:Uncharacterized protein n=1 Tax=Collybia nuda TaxID=64659 RepID=A0A9P5YEE7_9AGAR|nr:hypothetical protein BDZ94DRAFT_1250259 [Collybia nuda]